MKTLKYAVRFLLRSRSYTIINLLGLAFSLACCIILMRYIHRELTVDTHCVDREKVYAVCTKVVDWTWSGNYLYEPVPVDPQSIECESSYIPISQGKMYVNGKCMEARTLVTDSTFFVLYHYPLEQGILSLGTPQSALITEAFARKVFGDENPIGKVFQHAGMREFVVEGVLGTPDCKTMINFDVVLPLKFHAGAWSRMPCQLVRFVSGTDVDALNELGKTPRYLNPPQFSDRQYTLRFLPVKDVYWNPSIISRGSNSNMFHTGESSHLYILSGVCLLLLLVGILNFVNLYLTSMLLRGKEYGIKKIYGASARYVFRQIYTENLLLFTASLLVAWLIVEVSMIPTERVLTMPYKYTWFDLYLSLGALGILPFVTSVYPYIKFYYTSPIKSLRFSGKTSKSVRIRLFFLGIQYAITFLIIVLAIYFNSQIRLFLDTPPGFRTENILIAQLKNDDLIEADSEKSYEEKSKKSFENQMKLNDALKECPYIESVETGLNSLINNDNDINVYDENGNEYFMNLIYTTPSFFKTFDVKLVEGDIQNEQVRSQSDVVVLNRAAMESMGYNNLEEVYLTASIAIGRGRQAMKVLAIAEDYYDGHLKLGKRPIMYYLSFFGDDVYHIAYKKGKEKELLDYLENQSKEIYGIKNFSYTFLENEVKALYDEDRKIANIYTVFAFIAIVISCLGLFGISLFDIRQRYREIGIRKVNGAGMKDLYQLLFRKYVVVLGAAFVVAVPIAYYLITLYTQDFVVKAPIGIGIFIIALLVVALISLGTIYWQVHRAANINPADVVKSE